MLYGTLLYESSSHVVDGMQKRKKHTTTGTQQQPPQQQPVTSQPSELTSSGDVAPPSIPRI